MEWECSKIEKQGVGGEVENRSERIMEWEFSKSLYHVLTGAQVT